MFKKILKSFSALLILSTLFYSCGEQQITQPPIFKQQKAVIYEKLGLVAMASTENLYQLAVDFSTGQVNVNDFKKIRIVFTCESNSIESTVRLFLSTDNITSREVYTVSGINDLNKTDHAIDIEEPAEKIWLNMIVNVSGSNAGDASYLYTKVNDFVIYGIK
ncbi:MAG: hypothetical protein EHM58_13645 [Ignavibacteriae bacterium]|nr:MAG: hypothetical protein EHM58_13645 [Ignavibacteriota bacterium]